MKFGEKKLSWFPGHMNSTKNLIQNCLNEVDFVINLVDARAPFSSMNFSILKWIKRKPLIVFVSKIDLADEKCTKTWLDYFKQKLNCLALPISCRRLGSVRKSFDLACSYFKTLKQQKFSFNMIRVMVVGIPNVGKSTLINSLGGFKKAKAENRPGVTKSKQWLSIGDGLSLLDMPGVLPVEIENYEQTFCLQMIGAVKLDLVDVEDLALNLLNFLNLNSVSFFEKNFSENLQKFKGASNWLSMFAERKKMFLKGGELDLVRASKFLINEFQKCKFGKFTLEMPKF